jgi:hypothetical protein
LKKKKDKMDEIERDMKEIAQIDDLVRQLKLRYDPLCEHLERKLEVKRMMVEKMDSSILEERRIMGDTKGTVNMRKMDDMKLTRRMVTGELQSLRGYTLQPESTFYQSTSMGSLNVSQNSTSRGGFGGGTGTLPLIASKNVMRNKASTIR